MTIEDMLDEKQRELRPFFKPGFLQRENTVFQFRFEEGEPFHLTVTETDFSLDAGIHESPTLNLFVADHETCWGLVRGTLDGMQAFMDGRYCADGHIVLSQLLLYLFRANDLTNIYEVQD